MELLCCDWTLNDRGEWLSVYTVLSRKKIEVFDMSLVGNSLNVTLIKFLVAKSHFDSLSSVLTL